MWGGSTPCKNREGEGSGELQRGALKARGCQKKVLPEECTKKKKKLTKVEKPIDHRNDLAGNKRDSGQKLSGA